MAKKKTRKARERFDAHQAVTDRIIEVLERGAKPWVHPWGGAGGFVAPLRHNGERYRGMNVLLLWAAAEEKGYRSPYWMTFRQAREYGAHVRKGEKGAMVIKYGTVDKDQDGKTVEAGEADETTRRIGYLRAYSVFNAEQIAGLDAGFYPEPVAVEGGAAPDLALQEYFGSIGARIETASVNPCYVPSRDLIRMPPIGEFASAHAYYSVLAHELVHWTKPESRVGRKKGDGQRGYAFEELVAEIGACLTFANLGLVPDIEQSAAYVESWLSALRGDKKFIFEAASLAQTAADYIDQRANSASQAEAA